MSFKSGDLVQCAEVIQFLDYGKVFTVEVVSRSSDGPEFQEIRLRGEPGWHRANRFKLATKVVYDDSYVLSASNNTGTDTSFLGRGEGEDLSNHPSFQGSKASKNDSDKIDLSLIPSIALKEEAKAFMVGERKYKRYNYTKGHKASQLVAAAMRHLTAWNEGEECDPIDGQHHLGSVRACCAMILRQMELETMDDDRFKKDEE